MGVRTLLRHAILRRMVTIALLMVFIAVSLAVLPVVFVVTGPFALIPGTRARPIRFGSFLAVYLAAETIGLLTALWLWLRLGLRVEAGPDTGALPDSASVSAPVSGLGPRGGEARRQRYQDANYALLSRLLTWLYAVAEKTFGLRIRVPEVVETDESGLAQPAEGVLADGPLLVLSRHGGPGDSFLLVHALLVYAHRRPLIVLKDTLAFDPLIDVILNRVPHCFITPRHPVGEDAPADAPTPAAAPALEVSAASADMAASIGRMAAAMGHSDALLVFPEGANFTVGRRLRVIARLRRQGHPRAALRAQRLRNVLPPHPNGVFAAIDAAPGAQLVFVAHTGLDHMQSAADVWRGVPLDRPASVTWWTLPAARVPAQVPARLAWLEENWSQVDRWITREQAASEA